MKNPKLFLVTGTVYKTWYMEENPKKTDEISIVWAVDRSKFAVSPTGQKIIRKSY